MKKVLKNKKAFTLTEMIVVIAIIGILAGVLIPTITGYIKRANQSAAYQEAEAVLNIYETWETEVQAGLTQDNYFLSYYKEVIGNEDFNKFDADIYIEYEAGNPKTMNYSKNLYFIENDIIVVINLDTHEVTYPKTHAIPSDSSELHVSVFARIEDVIYEN